MSVASQRLMDNISYEDLYKRWEQGNWSAYDIDFSADVTGWAGLSDLQRASAMWIYSMFFYGEDRVADTLAPYVTAAPTEDGFAELVTEVFVAAMPPGMVTRTVSAVAVADSTLMLMPYVESVYVWPVRSAASVNAVVAGVMSTISVSSPQPEQIDSNGAATWTIAPWFGNDEIGLSNPIGCRYSIQ